MRLLQTTLEDGSPLVRRELVVALQWIVRSFLPSFVNLCRALQAVLKIQSIILFFLIFFTKNIKQNSDKDLEKSLKSKCLTRTYKKNKSNYMNLKHNNTSFISV